MSGWKPPVRIHTNGYSYEELRPPGRGGVDQGLPHHRILAWVWGIIDHPEDDPREVDHQQPIGWLNAEWNLQAVESDEHGRLTRERELQRKNRHPGTRAGAAAAED